MAAIIVSSLLISVATLALSYVVAAEPLKTSHRIQVTCDCSENQPAGTLITRLGDHNLTLKNFRAAESTNQPQFTVDADSGEICSTHDDQMDFESQREFEFRVLADKESEHDEFLAEFSAGLVDSGLPQEDLKSLSVATVVFDITVRVCDVPETPELADSHFSVDMANSFPIEFGRVNTNHQRESGGWKYYIASGNEDDIFQIDGETGSLTLLGSDSCQSDMMADFELEVLAENSAGEFGTSHIFVNVFREIPVLVSDATSSAANVPEEKSENHSAEIPTVLSQNEIVESNAETSGSPEKSVDANENPEGPSSISTLPNINAINVTEVQQWVTDTERLNRSPNVDSPIVDSPIVNSDTVSRSAIVEPVSTSSVQMSFQDSPGYLLAIGAFSIFWLACFAAVLIFSRTATNRAKALEDQASAERLQSALNGIQQEEETRLLKSQLADRDQTIAQLRKELHSMTRDFESDDGSDDDSQIGPNQNSWESHRSKSSSDSQSMNEESHTPSLPYRDSTADVRTSLGTAFEQIGQELARHKQSLLFLAPSDELSGEFRCKSPETAIATLDDPQHLRSELADLFAMHAVEETESSIDSSDSTLEVELDSAADLSDQKPLAEQIETSQQEVLENQPQTSEDLHLDSVRLYLSRLLERSQNATTPEVILVDRRKTTESHRSDDRRAKSESPRPPVKSYLDAYMSAHGGELAGIVNTTASLSSKATPEAVSEPPKPRLPVDVHSIRKAMDSFRVVSIQSSENALLSHVLRQAKAKIAWRTVMIAGLVGITFLMFLANMKHVIDFGALNWLMSSLVLLSLAELCLRIHAVMRQRRIVKSSVLEPRPVTQVKHLLPGDDSISE